jgi:8-oxo-dGTP diphosphatase
MRDGLAFSGRVPENGASKGRHMNAIRNSVKAVIRHEGGLLAIQKSDGEGPYYILPGGGQEFGETFHETLRRECLEEVGAEIEIGPLLFIREYIGAHHEFAATDSDAHQVEYMFDCRLKDPAAVRTGHHPDEGQEAVVWLTVAELERHRLYPLTLRPAIRDWREGAEVYLGDVN